MLERLDLDRDEEFNETMLLKFSVQALRAERNLVPPYCEEPIRSWLELYLNTLSRLSWASF